jgi:hypothetical protein
MSRFTIATKRPTEARVESIDVSSLVASGLSVSGVAASCVVYSGTDPSPSLVIGTPVMQTFYPTVRLPLLAAGVEGVMYVLTLTLTLSDGSSASTTGFLVVTSDPL